MGCHHFLFHGAEIFICFTLELLAVSEDAFSFRNISLSIPLEVERIF